MLITGGHITGMQYTVPETLVDTPRLNISSLTGWSGATFDGTPGDSGIYKVFNGSQSITTDNISISELTNNDYTYEFWIRTTSTNSGALLSKIGTGGYTVSAVEISASTLVTGYWNGSNPEFLGADTLITRDQWQHYTVTYVTGGALKVYYNGELADTFNFSPEVSPLNYNLYQMQFNLFAYSPTSFGNGGALIGDFGEFRLYTRTLTAAEVLQNFTATRSRWGI